MKYLNSNKAFILPTVIAISITILAVISALLVLTSASYKGGYVDHYQKLADEAAEAGSAYATACLTLSSHVQTWGPAAGKSNLTPNSDCNGNNSYASNAYVYSDATVRTYFIVGNLDSSLQFSAQISSQGYTEVLRTNGSISRTYTSVQKKVITWPTDVNGQMSASGTNRTCAIASYSVYCWGYNAYGQLGNGMYLGTGGTDNPSSIDSKVPVKVKRDAGVMAGKDIIKIFVAQYHSCALSSDGLMYCWGYNNLGQLGAGDNIDSAVPKQVGGALAGKTITDIGGSGNISCAIALSKIYCWGSGVAGGTGIGTSGSYVTTPTAVSATNTATTLATNYAATALSTSGSRAQNMCAIVSAKAYCWGQNDVGSVGNGVSSATPVTVPTKVIDTGVLSGKSVTAISLDGYISTASGGYTHACAIANGAVYCWGENNYGQLGDNTTNDSNVPVAVIASGVLNGKTIEDVRVGLRHSCVRASGGAYCWGLGTNGQLGDGTKVSKSVPVAIATAAGQVTSSNVISIGAGGNRGCAVVTDGRTFCWGLNSSGQIGDGTLIDRAFPTESLFLRPKGNQYIF